MALVLLIVFVYYASVNHTSVDHATTTEWRVIMRIIAALFFILLLSLFSFVLVQAKSDEQNNDVLFTEPAMSAPQVQATDPSVLRSRYASINWQALNSFQEGKDLVINLFSDQKFSIVLDHVDRNGGIISYAGHAQDRAK